jgi:Tfp pilus assembly protein PilF
MSLGRMLVWVLIIAFGATLNAQASRESGGTDVSLTAKHGLELAESGRCADALPVLKGSARNLENKDLRRRTGLDGVRCAMTLGRPDAAADFIAMLSRDFPSDPEVLYVLVHAYSDLSTLSAQHLAQVAPHSNQAHELSAEAFEQQGKWDLAAAEYRKVLRQNPEAPGVHFRIGRLLLSRPDPPADHIEQARQEMLAELKNDSSNAGAEYVLGELAHQEQKWDEAILHFSRASKLDATFGDAFLGWGESLVSIKKFAEAIPPLETAVKLEAGNPATHYNLAIAYSRTGHKSEADKEFAIHQQMTKKGDSEQDSSPQASPSSTPN